MCKFVFVMNMARYISFRNFAQLRPKCNKMNRTKTWRIHSYGDINELQLNECRTPIIRNPDDILVRVHAASVNPIDNLMIGGYGRTLFQIPRMYELEFPLTLGRDFSGVVLGKGHSVGDKFNIGDEVYGFIPIHKQGSFTELVVASKCHVLPKPKALSHEESASLVYATMTAWSALFITGNLVFKQTKGLRILVTGASGGVGSAAVQLLKSQGCVVFGTCSSDAVPLVESLGADIVYNRNDPNFEKLVELEGKYHIILDAANIGINNIPSSWKYETYITLNSPLLKNSDQYGLIPGLLYSASNLLEYNVTRFGSGKTVKWGFFIPSNSGFQFINELICSEKIKPVIHKSLNFSELPAAITVLREGHTRGKIVVKYE